MAIKIKLNLVNDLLELSFDYQQDQGIDLKELQFLEIALWILESNQSLNSPLIIIQTKDPYLLYNFVLLKPEQSLSNILFGNFG